MTSKISEGGSYWWVFAVSLEVEVEDVLPGTLTGGT